MFIFISALNLVIIFEFLESALILFDFFPAPIFPLKKIKIPDYFHASCSDSDQISFAFVSVLLPPSGLMLKKIN